MFCVRAYDDCSGVALYDLTGRQPEKEEGYPAVADLSEWSGQITLADYKGTVVRTFSFEPSDDEDLEIVLLWENDPLPDGPYTVSVTVRDDQGEVFSESSYEWLYACAINKQLNSKLLQDPCCGKSEASLRHYLNTVMGLHAAAAFVNVGLKNEAWISLSNAFESVSKI